MDKRGLLNHFSKDLNYDISFIKDKYLEQAFCINYYELKRQEGTDNKQISSNENKGNLPLALIGEKVFHLIKFSVMYMTDVPVNQFLIDHKKDDDMLAFKLCDKLGLFKFAYINIEGTIKNDFVGNDGIVKKSQLFFALLGAMYMSLDENSQSLLTIKIFINKLVNR
jgi:hypothetical protein